MDEYEWIGSVNTYLYIVERINKHFDKMKKTFNHDKIEEEAFYICVELLRILPFEGRDKIQVTKDSGICLLKDNIPFLIDDLNKILEENKETFKKIKRIRNKYEHEPHNVNSIFSSGSESYSSIGIYYKNNLISIDTLELTYIIYDLNILMNKIQKLIYKVALEDKIDIFTKEHIKIIKKRKNIEYNSTYIKIPKEYIK